MKASGHSLQGLIVVFRGLAELFAQIAGSFAGREDAHTGAIAHEDGEEFAVDDDLYLKGATAVIRVFVEQSLGVVEGFGFDVAALHRVGPEGDAARHIAGVFRHTDDVVEEVEVEVGIVAKGDIDGFNAEDAVERKVVELKCVGLRTEEKPAVAKLFKEVGTEDEFTLTARLEGLVSNFQCLPLRDVVVEWAEQCVVFLLKR